MELESLVAYLDTYLGVAGHPDYPPAFNGLQAEGPSEVHSIAVAVDASQATIEAAVRAGADLLLVHHGLFWGGGAPLTGPRYRRVRALVQGGLGVYACHLPLDGHPEVGNCALLARAIGVDPAHSFAPYKGVDIGWWGELATDAALEGFAASVRQAVGGPVHVIAGGPDRIRKVGVVTGGGASFLEDAVRLGLDALVTGEGPHHTHIDAMEQGIHVLFGGHYATETFGVRALGAHLADRFGLDWTFLDFPTGL